jgi:hypothetical protein
MSRSVIERAERVLNDISYALRDIQSDVYKAQDRIAKKTQEVYGSQKDILAKKPFMDICAQLAHAGAGWFIPAECFRSLSHEIPNLSPEEHGKELAKNKRDHLDILDRSIAVISSAWLDPEKSGTDAELQKLNAGQSETSTLQNSLQTMIQTHDAAIQRLQNMEASARQAG